MKKILTWVLVLLMSVAVVASFSLVGCKEEAAEEVEEAAEEVEEVEEAAEEMEEMPTLTMWYGSQISDATQQSWDAFQEETGYKLDIIILPDPVETNVLMRWAADERPDILSWHAISNWLAAIRPGENLIDLADEEWVSRVKFDLVESILTKDGIVTAITLDHPQYEGAYYNKEIFETVGVEVPKNYEELKDVCKKIKDAGITPIFMGGGDQWPLQPFTMAMWSDYVRDTDIGSELNNNTVPWTDSRILQGIEKELELLNLGYLNENILSDNYEGESTALMEGTAAMVFNGAWLISGMVETYGLEALDHIGFFGLSDYSDVATWETVALGTYMVPITGDPVKEEGAKEFLRFLGGPYYQTYNDNMNQYPLFEGIEAPPMSGIPVAFQDAEVYFDSGNTVPLMQYDIDAHYGPYETWLQEMIAGTKTPLEVGEALDMEFTQAAIEAGLEGFEE